MTAKMTGAELYEAAKPFIASRDFVTYTSFQRKFRIGYAAAEELIEQLIKHRLLEAYGRQGTMAAYRYIKPKRGRVKIINLRLD